MLVKGDAIAKVQWSVRQADRVKQASDVTDELIKMSNRKHHELESGLIQAVREMRRRQRRSRLRAVMAVTLFTVLAVAVVALVSGGPAWLAAKLHAAALVVVVVGISAYVLRWFWRASGGMVRLSQGWPAGSWRLRSTTGSGARGMKIRRRSVVGVILLLSALIYQQHPALLHQPVQALYTEIVYRPRPPRSASPWPWIGHESLHPAIAAITAKDEVDIAAVAAYIAANEPDPLMQVKAIHDYVIRRLSYDLEVLKTGVRPSQSAKAVFASRQGVCEGYANLFQVLARATGLEAVKVVGRVRQDLAPVDLIPTSIRLLNPTYDWTLHAWNAVKVGGAWMLVDATWDDNDDPRQRAYRSDYLMPAPEVMINSHRPDLDAWQLLMEPKSTSVFEAQPILRPAFFRRGLRLVSPATYSSTVRGTAVIEIASQPEHPRSVYGFHAPKKDSSLVAEVLADAFRDSGRRQQPRDGAGLETCVTERVGATASRITCVFPKPGKYEVVLFDLPPRAAQADASGVVPLSQLEVEATA